MCVLLLTMSTVCIPFLTLKLTKPLNIVAHIQPITWTDCLPSKTISNIWFERAEKELFKDTKIIFV